MATKQSQSSQPTSSYIGNFSWVARRRQSSKLFKLSRAFSLDLNFRELTKERGASEYNAEIISFKFIYELFTNFLLENFKTLEIIYCLPDVQTIHTNKTRFLKFYFLARGWLKRLLALRTKVMLQTSKKMGQHLNHTFLLQHRLFF